MSTTDSRPYFVQYLDPANGVTKKAGPHYSARAAQVAVAMLQAKGMQGLNVYRQECGPGHMLRFW